MSHCTAALKKLFQAPDRKEEIFGLQINEAKTNYLKVSCLQSTDTKGQRNPDP
jgi:hypothetical protein